MKFALKSLLAAPLIAGAVAGHAAVVQIDDATSALYEATFGSVNTITFSEQPLLTANPVYAAVTGSAGASFGSFFSGQSLGTSPTCPGGISTCVLGSPSPTLSLAAGGTTSIRDDGGRTVLASSAALTTGAPIAILFSEAVSAFSFSAGGFNNIGNTLVQAFSATGQLLGSATNPGTCKSTATPPACPPDPIDPAFFTFAFFDNAGANSIAGVLISLIGIEENGFAIDNVRSVVTGGGTSSSGTSSSGTSSSGTSSSGTSSSGTSSSGTSSSGTSSSGTTGSSGTSQVPEPTSLALVGLALLGLALARQRRLKV